jgi:hypothetical protein
MSRKIPQVEPFAPVNPHDLSCAPELASLEIVESAVRMALFALLAVHPTLDDFAEPDEPPSLRRARRLLASASSLDVALRRYRVAVLDAIRPRPAPETDDSPF